MFQPPCNEGLILLEGYLDSDEPMAQLLPSWLECEEVTGDPKYSLYELAKKAN